MKKESLNKLNKILSDDLKNYENVGLNDEPQKMKGLEAITKEANIIRSEEKQIKDLARAEKSIKLEESKVDLENKKLEVEQSKINLEKEKLEIERLKISKDYDIQKLKIESEKKQCKTNKVLSIASLIVTSSIAIISKCVYAGLTINAQKHDYEDYKIESPSSKENRNNLLKN